jgi:glycosyltransferase involved in cell wall biosynthesis
MRYRAPVVCSNVTSLPETIGNNDFIFNPNDKTEIVAKIKAGLNDEKFRERNIQNSINKMNEFQKIDYSNNFLNAYIKVIHNT